MKALSNKFSVIEYFVIAIVIFTATSLYFNDSNLEHKDMELISLTGNIELSTRESMDTFGLQDFTTNAKASLNFSVILATCLAFTYSNSSSSQEE